MNLSYYEGKTVSITDIKNRIWKGKVTDYVYPEDNNPEVESIIIKCEVGQFSGKSVEFTVEEILYIEEIEPIDIIEL